MTRMGLRFYDDPVDLVAAGMASHTVQVQRFAKSGARIAIDSDTPVKPEELIRLMSDGSSAGFGRTATFEVSFGGRVVLADSAEINVNGNAWLDISAPSGEGLYALRVSFPNALFGSHGAATTFLVSAAASDVPDKPKGGFGGVLGDTKWIIIGLAVLAALVIVGPKLTGFIPTSKK